MYTRASAPVKFTGHCMRQYTSETKRLISGRLPELVRIAEVRSKAEERRRQSESENAASNAGMLEWIRTELWGMAYDARGTVVERYLRSRGITVIPDILGFVPSYGPDRLPAMLAPFGIAGEPEPGTYEININAIVGTHATLLTPNGRKAPVDRSNRVLGRGHDAPLMLVPPNDGLGLIVTEGIEDALSAHQVTGLGAWAAGSAGQLPGLARHVPDWIETVTIVEDDNPAGRAGCRALGDALERRGIEVRIERGRRAYAAA